MAEIRQNIVVANWIAFKNGAEWLRTNEFPLFTDAFITGDKELGPYIFINTAAFSSRKAIKPSIILRYGHYKSWDYPSFKETDADLYHGGSPAEGLAALASLAMGIRLRAGRSVRDFEPYGDPKGRPEEIGDQKEPVFFSPRNYIVARPASNQDSAKDWFSMESLDILRSLPDLTTSQINTLIRSARLYQDALWLCETEPELTWLLFVSALESAANEWKKDLGSNIERLAVSKPDIYQLLTEHEDQMLLSRIAEAFAPTMGVTKTFREFCMEFMPSAPKLRPAEWAQFPWDPHSLKKAIDKIYQYRSKALHEGRPFPAPMCSVPGQDPSWAVPAETLGPRAIHRDGSTWMKEDIPFHLHIFEYITRESILAWWRSLIPDSLSGNEMAQTDISG